VAAAIAQLAHPEAHPMTDHARLSRRGRRARPRPVRRSTTLGASTPIAGGGSKRGRTGGQSLVEFALVFPLFILLVMSVIEFAFAFNANLAIAFASRDAALVAAEAGDGTGSDCAIIQAVINDVGAPADAAQISSIEIYWSDQNGNYKNGDSSLRNLWNRSGTNTTCNYPDGTSLTVPYQIATNGYPETSRCNVVAGCGGSHTPSVDTIGVRVNYTYTWKTPLKGLVGLAGNGPVWSGSGWNFARSNAMRMEPVL
jgi:Flp pilus assembly protein TadG